MKGFDPVEAYVCSEGLVRVATEVYKKPNIQNHKELYVHLTNSSLHKKKMDYMNEDDEMDEEGGPKRLLTRGY